MSLPRKLKNFILFNDGNAYLGEVPEVTLPKLATKTDDYRAGGMPGTVKIDQGLEALTLEWTAAGYLVDAIKQFGTARIDGVMLRMTQALQADDADAVTPSEIIMRGRHTEIDFGKAKAGDMTEIKYKTELTYFKLSMDGIVLVEIDMVNMVYVVGGVDRLAETRTALGVI
jgi:uncharacterized protein